MKPEDRKAAHDKIRAANNDAIRRQEGLCNKTMRAPAYRAITYTDYVKFVEMMDKVSKRLGHLDWYTSTLQDARGQDFSPHGPELASMRTQFEKLDEELNKIAQLIGGKA